MEKNDINSIKINTNANNANGIETNTNEISENELYDFYDHLKTTYCPSDELARMMNLRLGANFPSCFLNAIKEKYPEKWKTSFGDEAIHICYTKCLLVDFLGIARQDGNYQPFCMEAKDFNELTLEQKELLKDVYKIYKNALEKKYKNYKITYDEKHDIVQVYDNEKQKYYHEMKPETSISIVDDKGKGVCFCSNGDITPILDNQLLKVDKESKISKDDFVALKDAFDQGKFDLIEKKYIELIHTLVFEAENYKIIDNSNDNIIDNSQYTNNINTNVNNANNTNNINNHFTEDPFTDEINTNVNNANNTNNINNQFTDEINTNVNNANGIEINTNEISEKELYDFYKYLQSYTYSADRAKNLKLTQGPDLPIFFLRALAEKNSNYKRIFENSEAHLGYTYTFFVDFLGMAKDSEGWQRFCIVTKDFNELTLEQKKLLKDVYKTYKNASEKKYNNYKITYKEQPDKLVDVCNNETKQNEKEQAILGQIFIVDDTGKGVCFYSNGDIAPILANRLLKVDKESKISEDDFAALKDAFDQGKIDLIEEKYKQLAHNLTIESIYKDYKIIYHPYDEEKGEYILIVDKAGDGICLFSNGHIERMCENQVVPLLQMDVNGQVFQRLKDDVVRKQDNYIEEFIEDQLIIILPRLATTFNYINSNSAPYNVLYNLFVEAEKNKSILIVDNAGNGACLFSNGDVVPMYGYRLLKIPNMNKHNISHKEFKNIVDALLTCNYDVVGKFMEEEFLPNILPQCYNAFELLGNIISFYTSTFINNNVYGMLSTEDLVARLTVVARYSPQNSGERDSANYYLQNFDKMNYVEMLNFVRCYDCTSFVRSEIDLLQKGRYGNIEDLLETQQSCLLNINNLTKDIGTYKIIIDDLNIEYSDANFKPKLEIYRIVKTNTGEQKTTNKPILTFTTTKDMLNYLNEIKKGLDKKKTIKNLNAIYLGKINAKIANIDRMLDAINDGSKKTRNLPYIEQQECEKKREAQLKQSVIVPKTGLYNKDCAKRLNNIMFLNKSTFELKAKNHNFKSVSACKNTKPSLFKFRFDKIKYQYTK